MFDQNELVGEIDKLRRFALKLTRNESDADDLTQSTVLRVLEKSHLFEPGTNLFSWASKIMYNLFVSEYRRKVKFETQYDPESYIAAQSVDAIQENVIELQRTNEAMNSLSDDHRDILVMICVKGMQYADVSEALQIPVGTVRSRLSRARQSLQMLLDTPRNVPVYTPAPAALHGNMRAAA